MSVFFDVLSGEILTPDLNNRAVNVGIRVSATNKDIPIANAAVSPKLLKKRPTVPDINATGKNITTREVVVDMTAENISLVAYRAGAVKVNSSLKRWNVFFFYISKNIFQYNNCIIYYNTSTHR